MKWKSPSWIIFYDLGYLQRRFAWPSGGNEQFNPLCCVTRLHHDCGYDLPWLYLQDHLRCGKLAGLPGLTACAVGHVRWRSYCFRRTACNVGTPLKQDNARPFAKHVLSSGTMPARRGAPGVAGAIRHRISCLTIAVATRSTLTAALPWAAMPVHFARRC